MKCYVYGEHSSGLREIHPATKKGGELYFSAKLQIVFDLGEKFDENKARRVFENIIRRAKEFEAWGIGNDVRGFVSLSKKELAPLVDDASKDD